METRAGTIGKKLSGDIHTPIKTSVLEAINVKGLIGNQST